MQYLLWPLSEQFQNKNGSILTNGKIYVYYRGRTALATTWSDEDGTVENPQPIILDDNGRAACYVNPAYYYTVVVCDFYGKELFSYDVSLHDGTGTGDDNIEITSSDHSILIEKTSIIDGYRYDEKVNPDFVAEVAVSAVSDLIPDYINEDRTIVIKDRSEYDTKTKLVSTDMQSVMIRQQINNSSSEYKYAKICEADINTITWINEWMTTLQLSFQSNGAYYTGKSSGLFVLNCENYIQSSSTYVQRHEEDGKWLLFDKDNSSPQITKLYLYWRDDFSSQHYELWGEFNNLKYYEGVGVAAIINCALRNHLTSSLPIEQERNIWRFNSIGIETLKDALPTDAGSLVKTFDPADADIKPTAEPDPGTFYATYVYNGTASGNTSYEDIKAAYDAGKSVYVNYKENTDSKDTEVYSLVLFRDTPIGRPDLSCFYFTNMRTGTNKTIYRFPSNWGKMSDQNFASSDSVWDLQHAIATDYQLLPIPSPSGTYAVYGYHLYKSREEITEETSFDPTQWQEITVMDEVVNLVASTSGTTDVFIAKYQVTPVTSVFEAVDEGKFVWVSLGSDGHGPFLPMNVTSTTEGSTSYVRFEGLYDYNYGGGNEGRQVLMTEANPTGWEDVSTTNIATKEFVLSTVSGASSILESEIQIVSAAIDSASGGNFLAIYQSTPASAVYDALDAGKNVMVSLNSDGSGVYLRTNSYTKANPYFPHRRADFIGTLSFGENNITEGRVYLDDDTWSIVEYTPLPSTGSVGTMISNTVSTVSSVLETEIQTVSSALDAISGQNGVFIAEYGTTTFEEIGAAVADGKAVFGKGHPYNSDMLLPIASFTSPRPSIAIFSGIVGNYQYSIKLDGTTWSNDTIALAKNEDVVNADWDATSGKAEILNRPEIEPVSAGTGIEIVEVSGTMVISSTGGGSNYEAGQYISIVNDQISATGLVDQSTYNTDTIKYESAYSTVESNSAIWDEAQVNADWNASSGVAEILNKPDLSVYATEVDLESVSSSLDSRVSQTEIDITALSGAIEDIPPQVNSDWTATSGVAEILNKPSLVPISGGTGIQIEKVNGSIVISATGSVVPASGVFFAEYGVTTTQEIEDALTEGKEVIAYTTDVDDGTVYAYLHNTRPRLTFLRSYSGGEVWWYNVGDTWSRETIYYNPPVSGGIETVQPYNSRYYLQAKVDGTSIGINSSGALESLVDGLPSSTSVDKGKVLTVDSNGDAVWDGSVDNWNEAYDVVNASAQIWNEAAAMDEYPVSAGPGISIEDVDDVTVFSTSGVMMEADIAYNGQGEISGYNGSPIMTVDSEKQWLTHDDTIAHVTNSAQYAFGVNVPVVAQAMGTDETVLWSGTRTSACTLSESANSFERIRIEKSIGTDTLSSTSKSNISFSDSVSSDNDVLLAIGRFTVSGTSVTVTRSKTIVFGTWSDTTTSPTVRNDWDWGKNIITKVVGIGRKENT